MMYGQDDLQGLGRILGGFFGPQASQYMQQWAQRMPQQQQQPQQQGGMWGGPWQQRFGGGMPQPPMQDGMQVAPGQAPPPGFRMPNSPAAPGAAPPNMAGLFGGGDDDAKPKAPSLFGLGGSGASTAVAGARAAGG